jgi:hypothetical protein
VMLSKTLSKLISQGPRFNNKVVGSPIGDLSPG